MIKVSAIMTEKPSFYKTPLQRLTYETLEILNIPYERVDNDEAITMEECKAIDAVLNVQIVKTLFLCNRQETEFYLFVTRGDKPFRTKDFSRAMEISRVSFASADKLDSMMGCQVGATTIFCALLESSRNVHIVFDREAIASDYYGCSDGTTTGYMRLKTIDLLTKLLPYSGHSYKVIEV